MLAVPARAAGGEKPKPDRREVSAYALGVQPPKIIAVAG